MIQTHILACATQASSRRRVLPALGGAAAAFVLSLTVTAGPLNPPAGPVVSTGKTLTEVEPRTAINATNTPGSATAVHRITQPGSYYLTGNIVGVAGRNGIAIEADHVAIDLNGFVVRGAAGSFNGIQTIGARSNLTIRNGTLDGWGQDGVNLNQGNGSLLVDVLASNNGAVGIRLNGNAVLRGCGAVGNGGDGFSAFFNSTFESCAARSNLGHGFFVGSGSALSNCSAQGNLIGFVIFAGMITNCSAYVNNSHGFLLNTGSALAASTAISNSGNGIIITANSSVLDCVSSGNGGSGVVAASGSLVRGNNCRNNGGAGIHVTTGEDNRIEDNICTNNLRGVDVDSAGNIIVRNSCSGNGLNNWEVVAGNMCLVVQALTSASITGNSGGVSPGSTIPTANFTY